MSVYISVETVFHFSLHIVSSHIDLFFMRFVTCPMQLSITGPEYGGFILEARDTNGQGVGMFDSTNLPAGSQAGPCMSNNVKTSVTHNNPDPKTNLTFTWKQPSSFTGSLHFQGAVAVDHDTYWVNIMSSEVAQLQGSVAKTTPSDAQKLSSSGCYIMLSICVLSLFKFFAHCKQHFISRAMRNSRCHQKHGSCQSESYSYFKFIVDNYFVRRWWL
ncbi:hypothetical protein EB796_021135 [Bugula neritina]|uniref:Reelin domain-containing protein n=1 Tax=Bugula neritina TaxID=10212 RepID=A0A7J7J3Y0_BUGNE|nr:hypothetical protein EB796_021135 [Bugula neritina]